MQSLIIIPARYESSRFPGKPLADIMGKSLIQRVYEQCEASEADDIIVATDDQRIFDHVLSFDGNVCMTSDSHQNGTERSIEALERLMDQGEDYDIVINVQGDEPLVAPEEINRLIHLMSEDEDTDIGTLVRAIDTWEDVKNPNVVKVVSSVFDEGVADALYFSRSPIPYAFEEKGNPDGYLRHIGMYAFLADVLLSLKTVGPSPAETAERLEQLRWLQNHFVISLVETSAISIGVDTPEDIVTVENILKSK